jgi:hypothetical protein
MGIGGLGTLYKLYGKQKSVILADPILTRLLPL